MSASLTCGNGVSGTGIQKVAQRSPTLFDLIDEQPLGGHGAFDRLVVSVENAYGVGYIIFLAAKSALAGGALHDRDRAPHTRRVEELK